MQDRYTGDIGDFSKLGLLRALVAAGFSVGLNWYLVPDETHNGDGRHVDYLKSERFAKCDEGLWRALGEIVDGGDRRVSLMEDDRILEATFFSERLDLKGLSRDERLSSRCAWYERSLAAMAGMDVVCVDPDNGIVVPSAAGTVKEGKYVLPSELAGYYRQGSSVICYQHKARRSDDHYARLFEGLLATGDFPGATGTVLKFITTSQRYYLLIVQPPHRQAVSQVVEDFLEGAWKDHFRLL